METSVTTGKWLAYCRLMRIDKPVGSLLLLWPTLWALWLAGRGAPAPWTLFVFVAGVFLMRAAGCVINDYADRHFDGHVKRTASRPLPSGEVSEQAAKVLFVALVLLAFGLVLTLNKMTILLSVAGLILAWVYPFMKRISHLPQFVLGAAFGWSIPMAYAAVSESLPATCWMLFLAYICWTVAYDTQYAMVDRDDDLKIGVKSTAILFGRFDNIIIGGLQLAMLIILLILGNVVGLGKTYYIALLAAAGMFVYQQRLTAGRERDACFKAFHNNKYAGMVIFIGVLLGL
ncbi:4-hydroxybenzoate octaprenyltransferase [Pectobacterium cacticida]|uniref:4-hydroxybenzoate octaprenyltransferase n=1 Tax=Pectobacterium cacticida TaxID=69221 RepID=A0ABZ2GC93_9GAMM|nr:4-hydroxybenzoate octaprenyltransferase [Pectobacterium cacticida]UYX06433.1 4-hydroxybenzoate octaprenyltransferase [Pectobacterium cacticida]